MSGGNASLLEAALNSTSWSLSSPASTALVGKMDTPLWLRVWFELVEPWILLFGVLSNLLVAALMPRRAVAVASSAKIYYVSIAVCDCYNLINSWILFSFIGDTLYSAIIL